MVRIKPWIRYFLEDFDWLKCKNTQLAALVNIFSPSFINEVYRKGAKNKKDEEGNEHVIDGLEVVHFKQLTEKKRSGKDIH